MDLIVTFLIIVGTAAVLFKRARQDLEGNRPYVYLLGAIAAVSLGVLATGRYDQELIQWTLPLLFFLFVLLPQLLIYLRDRQFQYGRFKGAVFLQNIILLLVWSRNEREIHSLASAAEDVRSGKTDQAKKRIERVEGRSGRDSTVTEKLIQLRILVAGNDRNWRSVVREFDQLSGTNERRIWTPILIYVAQGCIELDRFRRAERLLNVLEDRSLSDQQEIAVHTARLGFLMLQGEYEAGTLMLQKIEDDFGDMLPAPYSAYWKARGCQATGRFDRARNLYEHALEEVDAERHPEWKKVIEERMKALEIEENRQRTRTSYSYQGNELDEPVDEWRPGDKENGPVLEAEPVAEHTKRTQPPPEVVQFIERVNRVPRATTVLLSIIGIIFLGMLFGVQKEYPKGADRISNPTTDPVALLVFGMKSDFMIDEPYEDKEKQVGGEEKENTSNTRDRIEAASKILSKDIVEVEDLTGARETLNKTLKTLPGRKDHLSVRNFQNLWIEARYAKLFGFDGQGNIEFPKHQYWRLATCTFLHIGWIHLLLNGYALWILGKLLENIYGIDDFLIIYLFSGLAGSVASWKFGVGPSSAGASGAIFGLLGAAITLTLVKRTGIPEQIRKRLAWPLLFWTVFNLVLGFVIPGIDNAGHIGGLLGGLLSGYLLPSGDEISGSQGLTWIHFIKWAILGILVLVYIWSLYKGLSFVWTYIDQIP